MEPSDSKLVTDSSLNDKPPIKYSLRNFELCPELHKPLRDTAIEHLLSELLKALIVSRQKRFIDARNRLNVPFNLFSIKLDNFYERRNEETIYLDILSLVCKITLEEAKFCIVLEDILDFIRDLFRAYQCSRVADVVKEIADAQKLLGMHEVIMEDYEKNLGKLFVVKQHVKQFGDHQRKAIAKIDEKIDELQNGFLEMDLTLIPIAFRYQLSYYNRHGDQNEYKHAKTEKKLLDAKDNIQRKITNEAFVSNCVVTKQKEDIVLLHNKIREFQYLYDRDYEYYDGQNTYLRNSIEIMKNHYEDSVKRLEFYAAEKVKLLEWQKMSMEKEMEEKRAEVVQLLQEGKTQKKNIRFQKVVNMIQ